jgi:cellulose synthase/poly-beta-1,6-N-acetylglucosamine synthase-like glycosyltransferase
MAAPHVKLSVVMPVYNERATLRTVVERVLAQPLEIELLCIDDGSGDGSVEILRELEGNIRHCVFLYSSATMAKEQRCDGASRKQQAISLSFRTRIWNTILQTIKNSLGPFARAKQMSSMVRAF